MAIMGTSLAAAGIFSSGTPEQMGEWIPQCFGTAGRPEGRRLLRVRARRRLRRLLAAHARRLRRGQGRVGPQRPEGVGDQRRHRQRPRRRRVRRPRARLARPGRVRHPARHQGPRDGHEGQEARPARLAHRRRLPRRLPRPRLLPARRQGEARRAHGARPRGPQRQAPGGDADVRGDPPDGRRPGDRDRPRRLRVLARVRQGALPVRAPDHRTTRRSRSRSPT